MRFNRVAAILLRQFFLMRGNIARVLPHFVWTTVDILLWGFITKFLTHVDTKGPNFLLIFLGAVLMWDFFTRVMNGITMTFFEDMWSRNFLNVFASPISIHEYISGLVLSGIITSSLGLVFMFLVAFLVFGFSFFSYGISLAAFLFVLFLFGIALGVFASAVMLRVGPAAEWFVWAIPAILSPFAGVFYPLSVLPAWMQAFARALPPSYVFEGMRKLVTAGVASGASLLFGGCMALFYIMLAGWFFTRVYRHAVQTGLIARYTAESIS